MSEGPIDAVDRRIIEVLRADGRVSINELASRVNVSRATAYARFERLRRDGVIRGIGAVVDPERLGLTVTAAILVNVEQASWREVRDRVLALHGLDYLAMTSGGYDFVLIIRVPDAHTLRDVVLVELHGIPGVRTTQTMFVLDEHGGLATGPKFSTY
ncbi:MAG: Lrp/AsnC family transcriptional regulator [Acidimicrobiales bacterium]